MPTIPTGSLILRLKGALGAFTDTGGSTPVASNGDLIARWNDQSGNAWDFSQATSGNRPTWHTNVFNGKPTVLCTAASSQRLISNASITHGIGTGDFWFACVHRPNTVVRGFSSILSIGSFTPAFYSPGGGTPLPAPNFYLGGAHVFSQSSPNIADTAYITEIIRSSGTVSLYQSSAGAAPVLDGTTFSLSTSISNATCYVGDDNGGDPTNSDIAEIFLYSRAPTSTAERQDLENYLRSEYWGISFGITTRRTLGPRIARRGSV